MTQLQEGPHPTQLIGCVSHPASTFFCNSLGMLRVPKAFKLGGPRFVIVGFGSKALGVWFLKIIFQTQRPL